MSDTHSFKGYSIVSCGVMRPELTHLQEEGWLDADSILFTAPGLHDKPKELESQLRRQLKKATATSKRVIVLFGKRCYLDMSEPEKTVESIMSEYGPNITRLQAANCFDFLASEEERRAMYEEQEPYWLTPGWFHYWKSIFADWDDGMKNETFPKHGSACLLCPLDSFNDMAMNDPEKIFEFSDWMGVPIEPKTVGLKRLKNLLMEQLQ